MSKSSLITTLKRLHLLLTTLQLLSVSLVTGNGITVNKDNARQLIQNQPVQFLENKGQMTDMNGNPVPFVLFKATAPGLDMYITEKGITYVFLDREKENGKKADNRQRFVSTKKEKHRTTKWERIDMALNNASIKKENIIKEDNSTYFSQYFLPHCPEGITNVHNYKKITIKDVYPGIDWVLYNSSDKGFKYDFIVHPGANPDLIQLVYSSLHPILLNSYGDVEVKSNLGSITEDAPYSYIKETGKQVNSSLKINNQQTISLNNEGYYQTIISFNLSPLGGDREGASTLVIDPQLTWATFFGGPDADGPVSISTDKTGNVFISGYTGQTGFPLLDAGTHFQGSTEAKLMPFLLKFNNSGVLIWSTFYGGTKNGYGNSVEVDSDGNVFLAGTTKAIDIPLKNNGAFFQGNSGGEEDVFIAKFDNDGNLIWSTYFGGSANDDVYSIAIDKNDNVFLVGFTYSPNFPIQSGGTSLKGASDIFILKFDNSGNLLWGKYHGGSKFDFGYAAATDNMGNLFITGLTNSDDFPVQDNGTFFQGNNNNPGSVFNDSYISKFDGNGNLIWSTYFGGQLDDQGCSVVTDSNGNLFLLGMTDSPTFPLKDAGTYYQPLPGGSREAFISKFTNNGELQWSTYYGSESIEWVFTLDNLAVDNCENVYFGIETESDSMQLADCDGAYIDSTSNGGSDIFLSRFSNSGHLQWATYLGGDGYDFRSALTLDYKGNLFVTGEWADRENQFNNSTYPIKDPGGNAYVDASFNGIDDAYIVKFEPSSFPSLTSGKKDSICCKGWATVSVINGCQPYNFIWSNGNQTLNTETTRDTINNLCPGDYTVTVLFNCDTFQTTFTIKQDEVPPEITAGPLLTLNCITTSGNISVNTTNMNATYSWSPSVVSGGNTSNPTVNQAGTYIVIVTDTTNNCDIAAFVNVMIDTVIPDLTVLVPGCNHITASSSASNVSFFWNGPGIVSGQTDSIITINAPGIYVVNATNEENGCSKTASIISTGPAQYEITQNVVTPDGDAINDKFVTSSYIDNITKTRIRVEMKEVKDYSINIYDRWGRPVFSSTDPFIEWDGKLPNGQMAEDGTYYWHLVYKSECMKNPEESIIRKGFVTLLRN